MSTSSTDDSADRLQRRQSRRSIDAAVIDVASNSRRQSRRSIDAAAAATGDVVTNVEAVNQWKLRKREEKKLKERRAFIEATMRRIL